MKTFILVLFSFICFWSHALKPDSVYVSTPDALGLRYESHRIQTTHNLSLQAWVLNPMNEMDLETTIVLAYGDAGNMSYWLNPAGILAQNGYTVVLFDYRGFGKSSPFEMNENQLYYDEFTEDLKSVYQWAKSNVKNKKIGVWGLSMGTIMTGFLVEDITPDFLILEGLVVNPKDIQEKILAAKGKNILLPKSASQLNEIYTKSQVPMLLFSGSEDQFTTVVDSESMAKKHNNRKSIVFSGGHLQGFPSMTENYYGDLYVTEINLFLK